jgi:hypothetical protein
VRPLARSAVWQPVEPITIASGTAAAAETTAAWPRSVILPQGAAAAQYRLSVAVAGGGKAKVDVRHKPGGAAVVAAESSAAAAHTTYAQGIVDLNSGRTTYAVTFTTTPTGVVWDISLTGFVRA